MIIIDASKEFKGYALNETYIKSGIDYVYYSGQLYNNGGNDLTFDQYRANINQDAKLISLEEYHQMINDFENSLITELTPVTEDRFYNALECLPPGRWHNVGVYSVFYVIERITGDIVSWYVKVKDKFYTFDDIATISEAALKIKLTKIERV